MADSMAEPQLELTALRKRLAELESQAQPAQPLPAAEMLGAIIQASPLAIVAITAGGEVTLWNAAAERTFGWTSAEVIGKPLPFIPVEKTDEHREMRARDLAGEGFREREIARRRKDGATIDLSVSTAPIRDSAGGIVGIMSIYIDITERKAIQDSLRQQAELLQQNHDAVFVWKIDGAIEYWNPAAELLYGWSEEEAVGRVSHQLLETESVSGDPWIEMLSADDRWRGELKHTTRDGRRIVVDSRQVLVPRSDGARVVLETNRDITERARAEAEIRSANDALRRANADLEQFAYAAAHDLQEPLRNMSIAAELLERDLHDKVSGDVSMFLETITRGSRRMQSLVNDLLAYTRSIEGGDQRSSADLGQAIDHTCSDLAKIIEGSGATIVRGATAVLPISEAHLSQLLTNLIGNAIKYKSENAPVIHVGAARKGREWRLYVSDNGIGIPTQYRERVFGLFKRLSADVPGTGLGLAICKRIVEHYGGRIWVEDGEGGTGSRFWIALPG